MQNLREGLLEEELEIKDAIVNYLENRLKKSSSSYQELFPTYDLIRQSDELKELRQKNLSKFEIYFKNAIMYLIDDGILKREGKSIPQHFSYASDKENIGKILSQAIRDGDY